MADGSGKQIFPDSAWYEGQFKDDSFHGKGVYQSASGSNYNGEYHFGAKHGKGVRLFHLVRVVDLVQDTPLL